MTDIICNRCKCNCEKTISKGYGIFDKKQRVYWGVFEGFQKKNQKGSICEKCWLEIQSQYPKLVAELREIEKSRTYQELLDCMAVVTDRTTD